MGNVGLHGGFIKKLFAMFMLVSFVVFAGCNSSTSDKKDDTSNHGNGGIYKVSGYVKLTSVEGAGIKDVSVKLTQSGATISSVSTNSDGYFECVKIAAGTYTVTPTKSGYTFNPPEVANVTVVAADVAVQTIVGTATGGTPGGNTYLPLKTGATWSYATASSIGGGTTGTLVTNCIGTHAYNGKTYGMLEDISSENAGIADTTLVRIENNIVYGFFSSELFKIAPKAASAMKPSFYVSGVEIQLYKFGLNSGQSWTIYDTGTVEKRRALIIGKYLGTETVQVTAGSFPNCAKFETVTTTSYSSFGYSQVITSTTLQWYAPNVGPVKMSDTTREVEEQQSYTYTHSGELIAYNIPE